MKVALFDVRRFERRYFDESNRKFDFPLTYFETRLTEETVSLVFGQEVVCPFVNDLLDEKILKVLKVAKVKLIALRTAGFSNVEVDVAEKLDIPVVRVPRYSPYAVAEHAVALIQTLNRKIIKAHARVREGNFSLDGLIGFDLHGKTVGIVGTGRIGSVMAQIMTGFGCRVLAHDIKPDEELRSRLGFSYVALDELYQKSDIISLHVPLTPETRHMVDSSALAMMKTGIMLINTSRGALIDSKALIQALKRRHIGFAGLDVYEEEENIFFQDLSDQILQDDTLARLFTFPNVLITSHQGFLTHEALTNIAQTTLQNIADFQKGRLLINQVRAEEVCRRAA